jgi:hypothetical protein
MEPMMRHILNGDAMQGVGIRRTPVTTSRRQSARMCEQMADSYFSAKPVVKPQPWHNILDPSVQPERAINVRPDCRNGSQQFCDRADLKKGSIVTSYKILSNVFPVDD